MRIALILFLFLAFAVALSFMVFMLIKKLNPLEGDKTESTNLSITQDFLPFEDIRNSMIILPNHCYRAVIECSSLNYALKTDAERDQIEMSFQGFINSLTFPISFFLQTKVIDNTHRVKLLEEDIKTSLVEFPGLRRYAETFLEDMQNLNSKLGNNQQKKRYIIVPYDDASILEQLSDGEKAAYARKELINRCAVISQNLEAVGLTSHMMDNEELVELVYSCYNRDNYTYASSISNGEAFSAFVDGENDHFKELSKVDALDLILGESINRIRLGGIDAEQSGAAVLEQLEQLRMKYAGRFVKEDY